MAGYSSILDHKADARSLMGLLVSILDIGELGAQHRLGSPDGHCHTSGGGQVTRAEVL